MSGECSLYRNGSKCQDVLGRKARPGAPTGTDNGLAYSDPKGDGSHQSPGMNSHLAKHFQTK